MLGGYDDGRELIQGFADGVREIVLLPFADRRTIRAGTECGFVNLSSGEQGDMAFAQQLLTGLTRRDIEAETGRNELAFVGPKGVAAQYRFRAQANAGLGVVAALESRVGDVVGFFLHTALHDEAPFPLYSVSMIRFARIMEVRVGDTLDAVTPRWITDGVGITFYFGGTSLLIIVGVSMDTVQQVESQLIMRHYDGFMRKTRIKGRRG